MPPATTIQQLNNNSNNENTVKSTPFWLSVREKWCLEKGIAKEIENYEPTHLKTLLERSYAEIKNKHGWTSETTILFYRKWFGHRLNNPLNCLAGLWTFFRLKHVKISLYIFVLIDAVVLTERTVWINYFCTWCARFASA